MANRPISPHLQIYRPQLTSVLSIVHRMTGVFICLGLPFLVYWVWTLTQDQEHYEQGRAVFGSILGRTLLLGWSFAFYYHLCNGVRHLIWDMGKGFEVEDVYRSGWLVVAVSAIMTVVTWVAAYSIRGHG